MRLSVPLYTLKRRARLMARADGIPLNQALDRVARAEGFARWSGLAAQAAKAAPARTIFERLAEGDLLLLGARPGHGKTTMALELLLEAARQGREATFFTLVHTQREVAAFVSALHGEKADPGTVDIVTSDAIGAEFIIEAMADAAPGAVAAIDYLQILDQGGGKPELAAQIAALQDFARERRVVLAFLSQIDRSYDPVAKRLPDMSDIALPQRLEAERFSKTCFLHDGLMQFEATA